MKSSWRKVLSWEFEDLPHHSLDYIGWMVRVHGVVWPFRYLVVLMVDGIEVSGIPGDSEEEALKAYKDYINSPLRRTFVEQVNILDVKPLYKV